MARKGLSITPAGNGCTPFGTKSSRNEDQQSYTEGKACFLHFTHTQLLVLGQQRQSPKVYLLYRALKTWHVDQLARFRSEEHTSELQSHSFISYAVFCLKKKN